MLKKCSTCKKEKDITKFSPANSRCKKCQASYIKKWRAKRKNDINYIARKWALATVRTHKKKYDTTRLFASLLQYKIIEAPFCAICGSELRIKGGWSDMSPTLDRIDNNKILTNENTQIICHSCNRTKSNRTMQEFIEYCKKIIKRSKT